MVSSKLPSGTGRHIRIPWLWKSEVARCNAPNFRSILFDLHVIETDNQFSTLDDTSLCSILTSVSTRLFLSYQISVITTYRTLSWTSHLKGTQTATQETLCTGKDDVHQHIRDAARRISESVQTASTNQGIMADLDRRNIYWSGSIYPPEVYFK